MVKVREDLTGRTFGRLTVIGQAEDYINTNGTHTAMWKCKCSCGNNKEVFKRGANLKYDICPSCGCYRKEIIIKSQTKHNDYEICGDYVIMYTSKREPFLVSIEDFWKVRDITWYKNNNNGGYIINKTREKGTIILSRLIMDCPKDFIVDHQDGDTSNNIRDNLRIATYSENGMNHKIYSQNTSGYTGVSWDKKNKKWISYITKNGKQIILGYYNNKEDAIKTRKEAEEKYFDKWSYNNSRR